MRRDSGPAVPHHRAGDRDPLPLAARQLTMPSIMSGIVLGIKMVCHQI
jgi:hypothetical protein